MIKQIITAVATRRYWKIKIIIMNSHQSAAVISRKPSKLWVHLQGWDIHAVMMLIYPMRKTNHLAGLHPWLRPCIRTINVFSIQSSLVADITNQQRQISSGNFHQTSICSPRDAKFHQELTFCKLGIVEPPSCRCIVSSSFTAAPPFINKAGGVTWRRRSRKKL